VALLTFGEGWHNNHHAHPQSARHGLAWYELDVNWYGIWVMRLVGLAWDVKAQKLNRRESKNVGKQFYPTTLSPETGSHQDP
jgi:stearoyl-CoA desaturase (delta-9 desaturase)